MKTVLNAECIFISPLYKVESKWIFYSGKDICGTDVFETKMKSLKKLGPVGYFYVLHLRNYTERETMQQLQTTSNKFKVENQKNLRDISCEKIVSIFYVCRCSHVYMWNLLPHLVFPCTFPYAMITHLGSLQCKI